MSPQAAQLDSRATTTCSIPEPPRLWAVAPALTTQLQRIERILGGALFTRDRRGVLPTPLGDLVLARARVLIPALTGLHDEASELITAGGTARYRVGEDKIRAWIRKGRRSSQRHGGGDRSS